jgi:nitronate monooxygenase
MRTTQLCGRLGVRLPIVQGPIGSASRPELAAAVANAGGLGTLALTWTTAPTAAARGRRVRELTTEPIAVKFSLHFPIEAQLDAALDQGVRIVSTLWGDPGLVHERIHAAGALHLHTVGCVQEARTAVDSGADVVVAQGWEAGGHVWGHIATLPLVPQVVDAVSPVPVIAAGGIADGRGVTAVLALGAQAAWLGTRFIASLEANTHARYRARILQATATDAVYTTCFDGGWPNAPHRVLRNRTYEAWNQAGSPQAPNRPGEADLVAHDPSGTTYHRYDDLMPLANLRGDVEDMALYAGQSVGLVHTIQPAAEIIAQLVAEAERAT